MAEIWKGVKDHKGYEVSSLGQVRKDGRIVKQTDHVGYRKIFIKNESYRVHRLVAQAFIGNVEGMQINHKDFNRSNNRLENLEILTHRGNIDHYLAHKKCGKKTAQYTKDGVLIKVFDSMGDALRSLGLNPDHNGGISNAATGKCKTYRGYIWKYV